MEQTVRLPAEPPIVYYGGRKGRMMKNIIQLINTYAIPESYKFWDVFGGSGIVGLTVKHHCHFSSVVINDYDRRIFAVHKCGELQKFKTAVYPAFHKRIVRYFYGAVNQTYFGKIKAMLSYPKDSISLVDIAVVSILRSIFNFRGKWKTDDNVREAMYGQYPPISDHIWKIPTLEKEMKNGITDTLYSGIKATNLDFKIIIENANPEIDILYFDPPYLDNTTVYRKGSGEMAIQTLELMNKHRDIPFIYSHDSHQSIEELASEFGFVIERFENRSRSNIVKTELLIHNLPECFKKRNLTLYDIMQNVPKSDILFMG